MIYKKNFFPKRFLFLDKKQFDFKSLAARKKAHFSCFDLVIFYFQGIMRIFFVAQLQLQYSSAKYCIFITSYYNNTMIKKSLKFNNKNPFQSPSSQSLNRRVFRNAATHSIEDQAENTLLFLSDSQYPEFQTYNFQNDKVSPWIQIQQHEKQQRKKVKVKEWEGNKFVSEKYKIQEKNKKRILKYQNKCKSTIMDYKDVIEDSEKKVNDVGKKQFQGKKKIDRKISVPSYQKLLQASSHPIKSQLKMMSDAKQILKKKIIQTIEKEEIISLFKEKKSTSKKENLYKPSFKLFRHKMLESKGTLKDFVRRSIAKVHPDRVLSCSVNQI